ncbi:MAG: FAD-binding protein [Planctomycetes bacterium SM23_32]|nr:MAG: FAD-binding protein [Planctomycetes bacterium SM23_32]
MPYSPVTEEVLAELARIVGERHVLTDPEKLEAYSHDEVADRECAAMPEVVVRPQTAEEVARIVRLAYERRIPVTPRGAGSGLSGGAVPLFGGIVLSTERMNHILEIDEANMMAVVEPGVVTNDINEAVAALGLFYAGYPMSLETCCIGGNVAENAGGGKAIKYGVTERYVLGLDVVLPTGQIVELGGKRLKDVTGYNVLKLMVGSEGTLGIVTRIILRLLPLPTAQVVLLVPFADVRSAVAVVPVLMTAGGVIPTAIELMDRLSVQASCRYLNEQLDYERAGAMLLIEVDGSDEEIVRRDYERIGEICLDHRAQEVYVADNHTTRERLWRIRRNIAEAFKVISPVQSLEDIVVPTASIPDLMPELDRLSDRFGVQMPCYGHAGDGNLHVTVVKDPAEPMDAWRRKLPECLTELYRAARRLGGTISGEHGIGSKRKAFMPLVAGEAELDLMRKIKRALDPRNILNPGKIVDL